MRIFGGTCALIGIAALSTAGQTAAQRIYEVPETQRCDDCDFALRRIAVLEAPYPWPALLTSSRVVETASGALIVAPVGSRGTLLKFPSDGGEPLAAIGRFGRGPGEFGEIQHIAAAGDSVLVTDANARVTLVDGSGVVVRSYPLYLGSIHDLVFADGALIAETFLEGPVRIHPDGVHDRMLPGSNELDGLGSLARDAVRGGFWRTQVQSLDLQFIRPNGTVEVLLRRAAPWFATSRQARRKDARWSHQTEDVAVTGEGDVAVLFSALDRRWKPSASDTRRLRRRPEGGIRLGPTETAQRVDWFIDVVDPEAPVLRKRLRIADRYVGGFLGDRRLFSYREQASGEVVIDIWEWRQVHNPQGR